MISPGNSFDPGLATTQSILGTLGRPIATGPERQTAYTAGRAWGGACCRVWARAGSAIAMHPTVTLFPQRYAGLKAADVYAALEVGTFHLGLWVLSWLVRAGLVRQPEWLARPLLAMKRTLRLPRLRPWRHDRDAGGLDRDGASKRDRLASGRRPAATGPTFPATASVLLAKRLLDGTLRTRGAMPCVGLFTLDEFLAEVADLDITTGTA